MHDPVAGEVGVLLVEGDRATAEPLVLQRPAHDSGVGDRQAVIAEADRAGLAQLGHLGQLLSTHVAGHGGEEADRDGGLSAGPLAQRADIRGGGDGRLCVGHREDPAVAARRRRAAAGLDVLLMLMARGAEVDVGIEEAREGVQALGLDDLGAVERHRAGRRKLGDAAGADHHVVDALDPGRRIEHGRRPQDYVRALAGAHVERLGQAHAGCPIGVGRSAPSASTGSGRPPPASSS